MQMVGFAVLTSWAPFGVLVADRLGVTTECVLPRTDPIGVQFSWSVNLHAVEIDSGGCSGFINIHRVESKSDHFGRFIHMVDNFVNRRSLETIL
jgi:hypothetical protein